MATTKPQVTVAEQVAQARKDARIIFLDDIDQGCVEYVHNCLLLYPVRSTQKKPVQLVLNSPGGSIYAALGIWDLLKGSGHKIQTRAVGICMSAAVFLLQVGHERIATPNTTFMIHEASGAAAGYASHVEASQRELERAQAAIRKLTEERIGCKLPVKRGGTPTFFTAQQALELNLIDRIEG